MKYNFGTSQNVQKKSQIIHTFYNLRTSLPICHSCIFFDYRSGFGNVYPVTPSGQALCVVYAILGIPIFTLLLSGIGERLQIPVTRLKEARPWIRGDRVKDERLKSVVCLLIGRCLS